MAGEKTDYTLLPRGEITPLASHHARSNRRRTWQWAIWGILATLILGFTVAHMTRYEGAQYAHSDLPACPQYPAFNSTSIERGELEKEVQDVVDSSGFFDKSLKRLQGAVQIPTESFDDMGEVGEDSRWDIFKDFHAYLEQTFPLVYSKLNVTTINTYGLLIEWKGKDESLKPHLFMAHQDVVPVLPATADKWKYPPYSAHYDGKFVWGRGVADCKNNLIGILESFETLLEKDFIPERTIMAGFGFDEEISGWHGAKHIADYLLQILGKDSIELIIDEGGLGIQEMYGAMFALPGLGEKGYFDVKVTVETAGGHSSVPPDHSSIGILSRIVTAIEDHPYQPDLTPANPYFTTLQCGAEYGPEMSSWLRKTIKKALKSKKAAKKVANYLADKDVFNRYLMQTSQAVDIVSGGIKINALPEKVYAVINHRIAVESHVSAVRNNIQSLIGSQILPEFPMSLNAWGDISGNTSTSSLGQITLSNFDEPLNPSPTSPYDTDAYKMLSGTIKQVFGEDIVVAPSVMTGNTDTKFYWDLSRNIYRFTPSRIEGRESVHTVDEKLGMKEHIEAVKFYTQMMLNANRS